MKSIAMWIGIAAVSVATFGGWVAVKNYKETKEANIVLKNKVNELENKVDAFQESENNRDIQLEALRSADLRAANLTKSVGRLQQSVKELKARSANSLEACNRSLSVAGEVLGECGEEYRDVATKAERLKIDAQALDRHVGIIERLVGLEPLNGN